MGNGSMTGNEKGGKRRGPPTIGSQSHPMSRGESRESRLPYIWQTGLPDPPCSHVR